MRDALEPRRAGDMHISARGGQRPQRLHYHRLQFMNLPAGHLDLIIE